MNRFNIIFKFIPTPISSKWPITVVSQPKLYAHFLYLRCVLHSYFSHSPNLIILNGTRKSHLTSGLAYFYTQRKMLVSLTHTPCIKLWAYIKNYYEHFYFVSVDWKSIKPATQIYYRNYTRAFKFNMVALLLYLYLHFLADEVTIMKDYTRLSWR